MSAPKLLVVLAAALVIAFVIETHPAGLTP